MADKNSSGNDDISISRARLGSITVYDVMEEELEIIERGSPNSSYLNIAIALLSVFSSFLLTLLTVHINSNRAFTFFLTVTIITLIAGVVLLIIWFRTNKSSKAMFTKIRSRKSVAAIRQEVEKQSLEEPVESESGEAE